MVAINRQQAGFTLIEVLVALIVFLIGFLGVASLSMRANQAEFESYQRAQALVLIDDIAQKLRANQDAASCYYSYTANGSSGTVSYLGVGSTISGSCTASGSITTDTAAMATADLQDWAGQLQGAAVSNASSSVGAMIGARGCITQDTSGVLIQVAWQAKTATTAPPAALSCGANLYGSETYRRVMARWVQTVNLTPTY
ncbi:type IV pilus modification protein PilV [Vogesella sp. LIG4]|uniref:type IV pilus modification protein PilV n=1 Tax=Vogesella sp. LIG4 TaxID=1192162 RepID=UPI0012FD5A29|nr:type IV pilus modification protein PilV [Vogesella sp. LIG4]